MKVRNVMQRKVVTIPFGSTYQEVARILFSNQVGGAPVVDADGEIVGFVSDKDLFRVLFPFYQSYYENPELYQDLEAREGKTEEVRNHKVERFMSRNVITIDADAPIMRAGAVMIARRIHRLPVVEGRKLVGMITREAIFSNIVRSRLEI